MSLLRIKESEQGAQVVRDALPIVADHEEIVQRASVDGLAKAYPERIRDRLATPGNLEAFIRATEEGMRSEDPRAQQVACDRFERVLNLSGGKGTLQERLLSSFGIRSLEELRQLVELSRMADAAQDPETLYALALQQCNEIRRSKGLPQLVEPEHAYPEAEEA